MTIKILKKNKKLGFTMIEALVAISILLIAVVGPLSLLSIALRDSLYIRNEITANYLAQEGLEVVTYFWDVGDIGGFTGARTFCIDGTKSSVSTAIVEGNPASCLVKIFSEGSEQYYGSGVGGEDTIFTRYVTIDDLTNAEANGSGFEEYKVTSTVAWNNTGLVASRSISYETHLFGAQ